MYFCVLFWVFFLLIASSRILSCEYLFVLSTFFIKMPKGYEFSQDMKKIFFNVIQFVGKEKFGPVIPLFNVNERLSSELAISMRSVERLKSEMKEIEHNMMEKKRKMDEEKEEFENRKLQVLGRLRNLRSRSSQGGTSRASYFSVVLRTSSCFCVLLKYKSTEV